MGSSQSKTKQKKPTQANKLSQQDRKQMKTVVLGGGCFWCIEAVFQRLKGVHSVRSGYAGGKLPNPTYHMICSGQSGYAQVIEVSYIPNAIAFRALIDVFLRIHDPTTLNRQGNDSGTQYRSIILYETEEEKEESHSAIQEVNQAKFYKEKVVTHVQKLEEFYPAEKDHQNFYNQNINNGYCRAIIKPKLGKLAELFKDIVNDSKM